MFQVLQTPNLGFGFQVFDMWLQNLATQPHQNELGRRLIIPASTSKVVSEGLIYLHTIMAMEFLRMELNDPRTMAIVLIYLFSPYPSYSVTIPHWWDLNSHCHENSYIYILFHYPCSSPAVPSHHSHPNLSIGCEPVKSLQQEDPFEDAHCVQSHGYGDRVQYGHRNGFGRRVGSGDGMNSGGVGNAVG